MRHWIMFQIARDEVCDAGKSRAVENLARWVGKMRIDIHRLCQLTVGDNVIDKGIYVVG